MNKNLLLMLAGGGLAFYFWKHPQTPKDQTAGPGVTPMSTKDAPANLTNPINVKVAGGSSGGGKSSGLSGSIGGLDINAKSLWDKIFGKKSPNLETALAASSDSPGISAAQNAALVNEFNTGSAKLDEGFAAMPPPADYTPNFPDYTPTETPGPDPTPYLPEPGPTQQDLGDAQPEFT